jgi:hypothetical protein
MWYASFDQKPLKRALVTTSATFVVLLHTVSFIVLVQQYLTNVSISTTSITYVAITNAEPVHRFAADVLDAFVLDPVATAHFLGYVR